MISLNLAEIAGITGGTLHDVPDPAVRVTGPWVCDSREAGPGGGLARLPGSTWTGTTPAAGAVAAGAVCVLASRPAGVPAVVVGDVTAALGPACAGGGAADRRGDGDRLDGLVRQDHYQGHPCPGAGARTGRRSPRPGASTPRSGFPSPCCAPTRRRGSWCWRWARGASADIAYLTGLVPPRAGLVVNVGTAHVGEFGSRAAIAQAKGELVEALPAAADGVLAVLNADDELVAAMASRTAARVLLYGRVGHADVRAEDVEQAGGRARFVLTAAGVPALFSLRFLGEHQVSNALGAAAVAYGLACLLDIAAALSAARPLASGRLEVTGLDRRHYGRQRRVQRQPRLRRRGTQDPGRDGRGAPHDRGPGRDGGTRRLRPGHEQAGRLAAGLGIDILVAVGGANAAVVAARRSATAARCAPWSSRTRRRPRNAARPAAARRRRARESEPRDAPGGTGGNAGCGGRPGGLTARENPGRGGVTGRGLQGLPALRAGGLRGGQRGADPLGQQVEVRAGTHDQHHVTGASCRRDVLHRARRGWRAARSRRR